MIGRIIGTGVAFGITLSAVSGIALLIALDFAGEELMLGALKSVIVPKEPVDAGEPATPAVAQVVEELPALSGAKDITFFKEQPIAGLPFSVMTGVKYASPQALVMNAVTERWCYIMAPGPDGVLRQIELAEQVGSADPVFELLSGIDENQLSLFKMGAAALEAIAKSHCRFDFTSPGASAGAE